MSEKPLSERQKNILTFINKYINENSRPPTIREIGSAVEISSTSVVNYNLNRLDERGFLDRDADVSRGLRLTEKAGQIVGEIQELVSVGASAVAGRVNDAVSTMVRIPMLGDIVAGEPIEVGNDSFSTYDEDDMVEVSSSMLKSKAEGLFALRVSGDSMIDAMVNDGDVVIMRQEREAKNGDMVAVWLSDDTTTLKYIYNEGERVRLQPANPTMEPIYVEPQDVQVQGKVVMVLRQP